MLVFRLEQVIRQGTGAIEIKSGYGLSTEAELKMLRVIAALKSEYSIPIRSTFLGLPRGPGGQMDGEKLDGACDC